MGPKTRRQTYSETVHVDRTAELKGSKLPSRGQVLGRLMQRMEELKETKREAARNVIEEVSPFWAKGGIPMREEQHCIVKLERFFDDFKNLKKSAYRTSQAQRKNQKEKEELFLKSLNDLFDVAHADAMEIIAVPEDRKFLEMQRRSGRPGTFSGMDRKLAQKLQRSEQRQTKREAQRTKTQEEMEASARIASTWDLSSGSDSLSPSSERHGATSRASSSSNISLEPAEAEPRAQRETRAKNIMTPFLAASLDRTKISDRNAVFVISAVAKSLGHDLNTLEINRTSIRTARLRYREEIASKLRVDADAPGVFSVHWDGKLLSDLTGRAVVDRLPVLLSTYDDVSLLGIPKLVSATGEAQASAIFECPWKMHLMSASKLWALTPRAAIQV